MFLCVHVYMRAYVCVCAHVQVRVCFDFRVVMSRKNACRLDECHREQTSKRLTLVCVGHDAVGREAQRCRW
jgi:hypothetical protein